MYFRVAKRINLLAVALMFFEIVGASAAALPWTSDPTLYAEELECSILDSALLEKGEEGDERNEEERWQSRVLLLDLSQIALSLSAHHSPNFDLALNTYRHDVRPPVHQLNCVFLL